MRALCLSLVLLTAAPAVACINDRDVSGQEEEFRSRYTDGEEPETKSAPVEATLGSVVGIAAGLLLLGGALRRAANPTL